MCDLLHVCCVKGLVHSNCSLLIVITPLPYVFVCYKQHNTEHIKIFDIRTYVCITGALRSEGKWIVFTPMLL